MGFPDYEPTAANFIRTLCEKFGDDPMIVLGDRRMTYAEAETRSAAMAAGLLDAGVVKGTHVGILLPNGPDWVTSWLAITRIGAIAIPFNTFFQGRELAWMLDHADIEVFVTASSFLGHDYLERLESAIPDLANSNTESGALHLTSLPYLRSIYVVGESDREWTNPASDLVTDTREVETKSRARLEAAQLRVHPADPMMILYSSGSTADPKGAVHSQGTIIRHSYNLLSTRDLKGDDRVWSPMPFFWVGGFVFSLLGSLHAGACILCEEAFEPERTLLFLERERATIAAGWPHFGQALANHPTAKERDLSALRGGNLPDFLPETIVPKDPELRPNALGMTETCGPHTCVSDGPVPEALRGSHGVPVPGVEHKIVDPISGEVLPPGETGEICVRGYSLMQGLYKVEREQTFDPDGFYHTGDAGFFNPEGVLYFKGRLGDMIKTAGANVTPSEVELVMNALPEVAQSYVVGLPDVDRGQLVAAAVLLEADSSLSPQELRERVKQELSAYKVPRHIFISNEDELPFTESGKIDKKTLAEQLAAKLAPGD
jgi:acyl-CoA synthetase (AMP-forming)/AMP-acid ligase II